MDCWFGSEAKLGIDEDVVIDYVVIEQLVDDFFKEFS